MNHFIYIVQIRLVVCFYFKFRQKMSKSIVCVDFFLSCNFWQFEADDASKDQEHKHFHNNARKFWMCKWMHENECANSTLKYDKWYVNLDQRKYIKGQQHALFHNNFDKLFSNNQYKFLSEKAKQDARKPHNKRKKNKLCTSFLWWYIFFGWFTILFWRFWNSATSFQHEKWTKQVWLKKLMKNIMTSIWTLKYDTWNGDLAQLQYNCWSYLSLISPNGPDNQSQLFSKVSTF